jgi:aldehyde:ferredoxin oxidoreductase
LELVYGNHTAIIIPIKKITATEALGDPVEEGVARIADIIGQGSAYYAMHVKGPELQPASPRGP